jgi:hypothetical protein
MVFAKVQKCVAVKLSAKRLSPFFIFMRRHRSEIEAEKLFGVTNHSSFITIVYLPERRRKVPAAKQVKTHPATRVYRYATCAVAVASRLPTLTLLPFLVRKGVNK